MGLHWGTRGHITTFFAVIVIPNGKINTRMDLLIYSSHIQFAVQVKHKIQLQIIFRENLKTAFFLMLSYWQESDLLGTGFELKLQGFNFYFY